MQPDRAFLQVFSEGCRRSGKTAGGAEPRDSGDSLEGPDQAAQEARATYGKRQVPSGCCDGRRPGVSWFRLGHWAESLFRDGAWQAIGMSRDYHGSALLGEAYNVFQQRRPDSIP